MKYKILLFNFFLWGWSQSLLAQPNIQFENINTNDGLSASNVNQVIQDQEGFIWMATVNSLSRYDGLDFKVFQHDPKNINSLSENNIRCVQQDSKGYIWAGTLNSGLNRYNYNTGKFTRFLHNAKDKHSISSNEILSIFEDSKGRLWVGTEHGLNLFDYKTETFTSFSSNSQDPKSLKSEAILTIAEDHQGWLWLGTWNGGLNLLIPTNNPKKFEFRHFLSGELDTDLKSNHVWKIFLDKEKRLWFGMYDGGLAVMLPNTEKDPRKIKPLFQTFFREENNQLASNVIFSINQNTDGYMWVATVDGLTVFTPKTIQTAEGVRYKMANPKNYINSFYNPQSLINNETRDLFIDKNGIVWCSTTGGISKFDRNSTRFNHFLPSLGKESNLPVFSILNYNEAIVYIATRPEFGLVEYNQITQTTKSYYLDNEENSPYKTGFTCFFKSSTDSIWIGTRTGIAYFNPITKRFKKYELKNEQGDFCQVKKIIRDKNGLIWLGTNRGLILFDVKKEVFTYMEKDSNNKSLYNMDITDILFDNENRLWIATYGGLGQMEMTKDGRFFFKNHLNKINDPKTICSNRVMSLALLNGEIWVGTENGLARYNAKTNDFKNFKSGNGLKNSNIISLVVSNDNRLWLGTRQGLIVLNPKTLDVIHYNEKDGIQFSIFALNSVSKNQAGQLFFGSMNGYIRFKSEDIKSNKYVPPIRITDITVFNKPHVWGKDVSVLKEITLEPDENYFTMEFAALNFTQSSDNQYAYKLEGFNHDWVYCGNKKSVSFSNLAGGTYTFRVKASNNDGVWNETGVSLKIIVVPPIWQRMWFRLLILLSGIIFGFLFYNNRINRINQQKIVLETQVQTRTEEIRKQKFQIEGLVKELKNQNNQLEKIVQERTATLERSNLELTRSNRDLEQFAYVASHDLQEPLRTIGSFTQLLDRKYREQIDKEGQLYMMQIIGGVKRMSELIKSLLSYSGLGRSDIEFSMENVRTIIEHKITDLALKIEEKKAKIIIKTLPETILCEPHQIGVVFYNLINNGIKFNTNPQPTITIQLENEDPDYWTFSVTDNGIGIDKVYQNKVFEIFKRLNHVNQFEGNGIGLAFCKRIILRHEGHIWFESELGKGTTFFFTIHKHIQSRKEEDVPL